MGQGLPENAQRVLIKAKIRAGCILHIFCDFVTPPHNKFVVVVHYDYDEALVLVFLVNSHIHPLVAHNPALRASQIDLRRAEYAFLDHDSYLNCSQVFDDFDIEEVVTHLVSHPNDFKGRLSANEIQEVMQAVAASVTLSEYDKNVILNSLSN
jgi:hypothetical protein